MSKASSSIFFQFASIIIFAFHSSLECFLGKKAVSLPLSCLLSTTCRCDFVGISIGSCGIGKPTSEIVKCIHCQLWRTLKRLITSDFESTRTCLFRKAKLAGSKSTLRVLSPLGYSQGQSGGIRGLSPKVRS